MLQLGKTCKILKTELTDVMNHIFRGKKSDDPKEFADLLHFSISNILNLLAEKAKQQWLNLKHNHQIDEVGTQNEKESREIMTPL